jgi:hypothetical protein
MNDWADLLAPRVLEPVRRGEPVSFRPLIDAVVWVQADMTEAARR